VPQQVFTWVTSVSLVGTLWVWIIIMYSHMKYRTAVAQGRAADVVEHRVHAGGGEFPDAGDQRTEVGVVDRFDTEIAQCVVVPG